MAHQIRTTEAKALLADPSVLETTLEAARQSGFPRDRIFQFSDAPVSLNGGIRDWRDMIGGEIESEAYRWPELSPSESKSTVATINFSSGTTGLPKGVCVSHANLIANTAQNAHQKYVGTPYSVTSHPRETWLGFLPLYHAYGQLYTILIALKLLIPVHVMRTFVYEDFLRVVQEQRVTHLQVAPPIVVMLDKRPETSRYDISSIKQIICGAAPLSGELQNSVGKKFGIEIRQAYGMTELTCGAIQVPGGSSDATGSVGILLPNSECKVINDEGKEVGEGIPGEMYIRGPNVCMGYWKNPSATAETLLEGGWLKTGDVGVVKNDWMWIVDRKKELIKVNGLQVAPAELEAVLLENEDVADAAVVGITLHDEEWPRGYIVLKEEAKEKVSADDILRWMKPRVAKHKQLVGGIAFIDEVPKLASGKIQRKVMREWAKRDAPGVEKEKGMNVRSKL